MQSVGLRALKEIILGIIIAAGALILNNCSGGSAGGGGGSPQAQGNLALSLTDASGCNFDGVFVAIKKVRVHVSASAGDSDPGWVDILPPNGPTLVNLLDLQNGLTAALGVSPLPPGHYQQVRLYLAPNTSSTPPFNDYVTVGNSPFPLNIPQGFQNGIKIPYEFDINPTQQENLIIDFDACNSIVKAGTGTYVLRPSVLVVRQAVAGKIVGAVDALLSGAVVKAEINGFVYKQTQIKSDGTFTLYPLPEGSIIRSLYPKDPAGTYDVVIVAEGYTTVLTTGVPVTSGTSTVLGTTTSPITLASSPIAQINGHINPTSADARIRQSINGNLYQTDRESADLIDGSYQSFLATASPLFGAYSATLPVKYAADQSAAGNFTIDTPNDDGLYAAASQSFTATSAAATTIDFTAASALSPTTGTAGTVTGSLTVTGLPAGFNSGTAILSATIDNENVNSIGIPISASGSIPFSIDDLAPGTYTLTFFSIPGGFHLLTPQSIQVEIPAGGGTFTGNTFSISP